jgi:hypothetical protein
MQHESWTVVRKVRLRADLKPVGVYGADAQALPIDWLTVVLHRDDENPLHETFALAFSDDSGVGYGWYQYDTLQIALDQAHDIFGVAQEEWEVANEDARSSPVVSWILDSGSA